MAEHATATAAAASPSASSGRLIPFKYSNRVVLNTILESGDGGFGFVGRRVVIGGWVKSSKEIMKETLPSKVDDRSAAASPGDVSCTEILQSRIPFIRSIIKILGGGNYSVREKFESAPKTPPSVAFLQVSDGSCASSLQVVVDSSIAPPSRLLPTGTCIVAEGELKQPSVEGKHAIELLAVKVLHIGTVDHDKYPLSKKRLPLNLLRESPHFRPRTTTVASVMRIRSALGFAVQTFSHNNGFVCVQVPIITVTDCEGFSEKFRLANFSDKVEKKEEQKVIDDTDGVSLETVQAAIEEKSNIVENLKRSESNREALLAATQDLRKTNELAKNLEAKEKSKSKNLLKDDKKASEEFFSHETYLTVSGRLHLESYACSLGNVYSFGPRFRAHRTESAKQVAEMWMFELEMAFSQLEDAMRCAEDLFKFLCKWVLENCSADMKFVLRRIDKTSIDRLESVISTSTEQISYTEALNVLRKAADKRGDSKLEWGTALTTEHLSYLVDEIYKRPVIVYNYPKQVKPFYVRVNDDGKTVAAFDLVVPKVGTLISGSQNEERLNMISSRIKELGLAEQQYEWYLDLRRQGTVKHAGFSFGFDLMVLFATGLIDVRDIIPFPITRGKLSN
ncbi:hypothetical protein UlMin_031944 [Ulmus minor]